MSDSNSQGFLSDQERERLVSITRRRKVEALVWKRARAFLLLDSGEDAATVCRILDIGPTVLVEWQGRYKLQGSNFSGLKDYSQREGHLSAEQEAAVRQHFEQSPARSTDQVRAHILQTYDQQYSKSGAIKLMHRLGFEYKKPKAVPTQADEKQQAAFIEHYNNVVNGLLYDEMVVFSDAVHPEYQSRPAHGWFIKSQKTAIRTTSGRKRLNIQGALDLETFDFTFVDGDSINATTTKHMLRNLEAKHPDKARIHVFVDNARYHRAKKLKPWLNRPDRRVKLHFLPSYCPHLNPIERLWGVMHKYVTHNRYYATYDEFTTAILEFLRKTLPKNWKSIRDTVTDNFRIISNKDFRLIQ
jgi:transposase